jgi:hypothetical protein
MMQSLKTDGREILDEPENEDNECEYFASPEDTSEQSQSPQSIKKSPMFAKKSTTADPGAIIDQKEKLDPLQQTLADEIKILRDDYVKNGGSNPDILAQIEMLEEEALLKNGNQFGIPPHGDYLSALARKEPAQKFIPGELKENEIKETKLDHEMKILQINQEKERIVCEQDLYKLKKELGLVKEEVPIDLAPPVKIVRPTFPDKVMDVNVCFMI